MEHRTARAITCLVAALVFSPCRSFAHEVPSELTVETFVRPVRDTLQVLVRVPLSGLLGTGMPKEGVGYLALDRIDPSLRQTAIQISEGLDIFEGDARLSGPPRIVATRIALPFDASFSSYDLAIEHLKGPPLPVDTQVYWMQGYFDAWLEYPIQREDSSFSIRTRLVTLAPQVTTSLRFLSPGTAVRSFSFLGDPGRVWLEPRWYQTASLFVKLGFLHAIRLPDEWLFVFCLLVPWRRPRALVPIVGSFAAGYALTDLVVAYGPDATGPWLPPLVATLIAALLVYLALENIAERREDRRWVTTVMFGVLAGLGFSIAMRQVAQFSGGHLLTSVVSFDAGVALALVSVMTVLTPLLAWLYACFSARRLRTVMLSALIANVAWRTLADRAAQLPDQQWPIFTPETWVTTSSWLLVVVVAVGGVWLAAGLLAGPDARVHAGSSLPTQGAR